jgi:hypothetical protein
MTAGFNVPLALFDKVVMARSLSWLLIPMGCPVLLSIPNIKKPPPGLLAKADK